MQVPWQMFMSYNFLSFHWGHFFQTGDDCTKALTLLSESSPFGPSR